MPRWDRPRATREFANAVLNGVLGAVLVGVVVPASIPLRIAAALVFLAVSVLIVWRLRAIEVEGTSVVLHTFLRPPQRMELAPPFRVVRERVVPGVERVTLVSEKESVVVDTRPSLALKTAWIEHVAKQLNELKR